MIFTNVLDTKKVIVDENGNEIYDMTESILSDGEFTFTGAYRITEEYEMRPDLLVNVLYGNFEKFGEFMKANRVSNPFAMEANEIVFIPDTFTVSSHFDSLTSAEKELKEIIRNQYIDSSKQNDLDNTRKEIDEFKKREKLGLPPNILDEGEKEVLIQNGRIIYGPHVSTKTIEQTESKEQYLRKLTNGK